MSRLLSVDGQQGGHWPGHKSAEMQNPGSAKNGEEGSNWLLLTPDSCLSGNLFLAKKDKDVDKYVLTPGRFGGKVFFANNVHILVF